MQECRDKQFVVRELHEAGGGGAKRPPKRAVYKAAEEAPKDPPQPSTPDVRPKDENNTSPEGPDVEQ